MESISSKRFSLFIERKGGLVIMYLLMALSYSIWTLSLEKNNSEPDKLGKLLNQEQKRHQVLSPDTGRIKFYYLAQFAMAPTLLECELPNDSTSLVRISTKGSDAQTTFEIIKE
ncbi:MAG: hypothetical protein IPL08_11695 [Saprospiraceae bacterium]|nr:hypothetical protein [Saprospiraceae bacterium]